jgi:hypothetical protein
VRHSCPQFAQIILEPAERGCLSRSTFDSPKTLGISRVHLAILAAAGGTPALRSISATHPSLRRDKSACFEQAPAQAEA